MLAYRERWHHQDIHLDVRSKGRQKLRFPPPPVSRKRYQSRPRKGCFPGNIPSGDLHETRDQRTVALALEIEWTNKDVTGKQLVLAS